MTATRPATRPAAAATDCLNPIASFMPDLESVMRGGGRMKDAGYGIEWGPGRHGPGNNRLTYVLGPAGFVTEYRAAGGQRDARRRGPGPQASDRRGGAARARGPAGLERCGRPGRVAAKHRV